jgi:hypothetical protein
MTQQTGTAILALLAAATVQAQQLKLASAEPPPALASLMGSQDRPMEEGTRRIFDPPDPNLTRADGRWGDAQKADSKITGEFRATSDADPLADLTSPKAAPGAQTPRPNDRKLKRQRARELHATALALYKATSSDAETFTAALLLPEVRRKVEAALHQKLSDEQCRGLTRQAQAEALYWYKYMQGLERAEAGANER